MAKLVGLEAILAEVGGLRVVLQRRARAQLAAAGLPVTRGPWPIGAVHLLQDRDETAAMQVKRVAGLHGLLVEPGSGCAPAGAGGRS